MTYEEIVALNLSKELADEAKWLNLSAKRLRKGTNPFESLTSETVVEYLEKKLKESKKRARRKVGAKPIDERAVKLAESIKEIYGASVSSEVLEAIVDSIKEDINKSVQDKIKELQSKIYSLKEKLV